MGGSIAAAYADRHPAAVAHLVLLATGGFGHDLGRFLGTCVRVPVVGDWVFGTFAGAVRRNPAGSTDAASIPARAHAQTRTRGYARAVLSSARAMLALDMTQTHVRIARLGIPVTAIWGDADRVIPLVAMGRLQAVNPRVSHYLLAGAGHDMTHSRAAEVADLLP
jgi:pimeloyl-ACP methyl ester carboxylesterase